MKKAPCPVRTLDSNLIGESVPFWYCSRVAAIKEKKKMVS